MQFTIPQLRLLTEALVRREAREELRQVGAMVQAVGGMLGKDEARSALQRRMEELAHLAGNTPEKRSPAGGKTRRPPPWKVKNGPDAPAVDLSKPSVT